jgi:Xaa-Pro aminopeptidase
MWSRGLYPGRNERVRFRLSLVDGMGVDSPRTDNEAQIGGLNVTNGSVRWGGGRWRVAAGSRVLAAVFAVLSSIPSVVHAQVPVEEYGERRGALAEAVGDGVILALGSAAPPQDYIPFFQSSPFRYLTGFTEPDAALLMVVEGGRLTEMLFVNPRNPAEETWEGYRMGPEGVSEALGISGRDVGGLQAVLDSVLAGRETLSVVAPWQPDAPILNHDTQRLQALLEGRKDVGVRNVTRAVAELRQIKSEAELDLLRKSAAITAEAHREVLGSVQPGMNEFEIQALIEYTFRRYGSERPAFASIVGSGPNSTILHYNRNDRFMGEGDVLVVDIGAASGGYAADITRTIPVSGRFTDAQREIYQIVRDAQAAAEAVAGPGVPWNRPSQASLQVLATGLADVGLIQAPDATFDCEQQGRRAQCPQFFLYYMHGLGHGIGLDVHDPMPGVLAPGAAFTIEPGIYVRPNLFTEVVPDTPRNRRMIEETRPAWERYVNIGVRIEDDYIVTEDGLERISPAPREIHEIEDAMARPWRGPGERREDWVEWYRRMR